MTAEDARVSTLVDEAKVFMSIQGPGKDVMKAVFQAFYSSPRLGSNNGQMTLKEYNQRMGNSNKKIRDIFGSAVLETGILDIDIMQADLDITFYIIAVMNLNKTAFNSLDINSQEMLNKLKCERSKLLHQADRPFPDTLSYLEGLYIDVLDAFDQEFPGSPYLQDARVSVLSINNRIRNLKLC